MINRTLETSSNIMRVKYPEANPTYVEFKIDGKTSCLSNHDSIAFLTNALRSDGSICLEMNHPGGDRVNTYSWYGDQTKLCISGRSFSIGVCVLTLVGKNELIVILESITGNNLTQQEGTQWTA